MDDAQWVSFLCERPPLKLLDSIYDKRLEFYEAARRLTPTQILRTTPVIFPAANAIDFDLLPGVGYFDVDAAMRDDAPYFSHVSWVALCHKIAEGDLENLACIYDLTTQMGATD